MLFSHQEEMHVQMGMLMLYHFDTFHGDNEQTKHVSKVQTRHPTRLVGLVEACQATNEAEAVKIL